MTESSAEDASTEDMGEKARRRNAWALLATHAVAFVLLFIGFVLRFRYVEAEGIHVDWLVIVIAIVGTVVFIVLLALLLVFRRRAALRHALAKGGVHGPMMLGYWSRANSPPFLTQPLPRQEAPAPRGRGLEVAISADSDGVHVHALVRRRLIGFGLIPWSHIETIGGGSKTVGVGFQAKGGALRIDLRDHTPPYGDRLEFFPAGQTAVDAARVLSARLPPA